MNKKTKNKFSSIIITLIELIIFCTLGFYIYHYPYAQQTENLKLSTSMIHTSSNTDDSWENFQDLPRFNILEENQIFSKLSENDKNIFHRNFFKKIQSCLFLTLTAELETQLIYNLVQGSSRDAVLRGLLSKQEVIDYIDQSKSNLLSENLLLYIGEFNRKYLQRDDFELPIDMREYELKVALMEEFLDVADKHLVADERKFYLWAAYILKETTGKFSSLKNNQQMLAAVRKIPLDQLKSEIALSICQVIDNLSKKNKAKFIQNQ